MSGARERGSALALAMLVGLAAAGLAAALIGRVVVEHRAVEDSLAQLRLHWAAMGHATYLMSRIRQDGSCDLEDPCRSQPDRMPSIARGWLHEIRDLRTWRYPEAGPDHAFVLSTDVQVDPRQPSGQRGRAMLTVTFARAAGSPESLRVAARARRWEMRYCLAEADDGDDEGCGDFADDEPARVHVVALHRGPRP